MKMTTAEARALLEDPQNRLAHLGASLFATCADVQGWFDDHPECRKAAKHIDLGYAAAGLLVEAGQ